MNLLIKYNPSSSSPFLKQIAKLGKLKTTYMASTHKVDRNVAEVKEITPEEFEVLKNYWQTADADTVCGPDPCQCSPCTYKRLIFD